MDFKAIVDNFITIVTKKFFCFEGKADRKEFWFFFLANFVIVIVLGFIPGTAGKLINALFSLALLLPGLGAGARRLHDIGKSGWLQLIAFIPVIGILVLIYFWAQPGTTQPAAPQAPSGQA
ncbi:MAG: DUF805 domain-containing protein [Victivallales bacterium]|nr:DUF805 domain-containing protein [Victivallales bacterium]